MSKNIYTIGFTKKRAEVFFERLKENNIDLVIDIRLDNRSQLSGFAKSPDIEYFLKKLSKTDYIHDENFAPTKEILRRYKNKDIDWNEYVNEFTLLMNKRKIELYIKNRYNMLGYNNICLLCSEDEATNCHRSLVAKYFQKNLDNINLISNL